MFNNKDILYIIPITKKTNKELYDSIKDYSNILLLDNNIIDKSILPNKYKFTIMKFSEEWGKYILNSKYKKYCFISQNILCKQNVNSDISDSIITITYNYAKKTRYKHVYNRLLVFDKDSAKSFLNMPLKGFKSNVELIDYTEKENILYTLTDQKINTNIKSFLNSLKVLIPSLIKIIIPYVFSVIFFVIFYYLIKMNNTLERTLVSNVLGGVVGVVLYVIFNYTPYFKNNIIRSNIIDILIKIVKICISGYIIYLLFNLIGINIIISKVVADFLLLVGVEIIKIKLPTSI